MNITELKTAAFNCETVASDKPQLLLMLHNAVFQPKVITGDSRRDLENLVSLIVDSLVECGHRPISQ